MVVPLSTWPWENLGIFKYVLILSVIREFLYLFWNWENFIILQTIILGMVCYIFLCFQNLPLWNINGFIAILLLHVIVSEPHKEPFFTNYHSLQHSFPVLTPLTAGNAMLLEHLVLCIIIGVPILGASLMGFGSGIMICGYILAFDFLRCLGHCNVEIIPLRIFEILPFLKYLLYMPTYHSLFMPVFDLIWDTLNKNSWKLHKEISGASGKNVRIPDFVFLAHVVDVTSSMHAPYVLRMIFFLFFSLASLLNVMDMEHELRALRVELAENSKRSLQL